MKEIIFVTIHLTDGGAERVASELVGEWVKRGIKVIIVQLMPQMFANSYKMPTKVEYIDFDLGKSKYLKLVRGVKGLVRVMNEHPNATVIGFAKKTVYVIGIASLFTKNRIVLSERNDPYSSPKTRARRMLRDWAFKRCDACVFQTPDARDYFPEIVKKKGVVIPNPINSDIPQRYEGERKKEIVAVGRLHPQKNFPVLIKAFSLLHNEFPEYKLIIYGRGLLEKELKELSANLGVGDFVIFPGFSDSIYQDMLKCSVYVSSSDYEGMSNSMLEALAMGIPSVISDCPIGGARMVIENNVNGILVPVGDALAIRDGIKRILTDRNFAETIGRNAAKLKEQFPITIIADRWIELL